MKTVSSAVGSRPPWWRALSGDNPLITPAPFKERLGETLGEIAPKRAADDIFVLSLLVQYRDSARNRRFAKPLRNPALEKKNAAEVSQQRSS